MLPYAEYLLGQGLSENTVADYQREVELALAWFQARGLDLASPLPSHIIDYVATRPKTPSVRAHIRSGLRYWWKLHGVNGYPEAVDVPTAAPMVCKALSVDETRRLAQAARGWWRPGTAVLVGMGLGLRNEEIAGMRWDGFTSDHSWYTCVGKGSKQRTVAVPPKLAVELDGRRNGTPWVFEGRFGGPVSHATIWNWVREVAAEADIQGRVFPHRLRHTFGATANDDTGDLRAVARAMGHARVQTTEGYTRTTEIALRKVASAIDRYL